jgi:hypothetical protein
MSVFLQLPADRILYRDQWFFMVRDLKAKLPQSRE